MRVFICLTDVELRQFSGSGSFRSPSRAFNLADDGRLESSFADAGLVYNPDAANAGMGLWDFSSLHAFDLQRCFYGHYSIYVPLAHT